MTWWLIGILGYFAALGAVLLLAGGVRRGDGLHAQTLQALDASSSDPTDPRDNLGRPATPQRATPRLRTTRR
jgi:hypothetical protein